MKYSKVYFDSYAPIIFNITLVIAYIKKRNLAILMLSFICIYFYRDYFNIYIVIFEYILYFIVYLLIKKKKNNNYLQIFVIIKSFFYTLLSVINKAEADFNFFIKLAELLIIFYIIAHFVLFLFSIGEKIMQYHMTIKELEKEKQIRTSLFKITHEIKNPLAVCKGYLEMFNTENLDHSRRYVPILRQEIERTLLLLKDFGTLANMKIDKAKTDIFLLLNETIDDFVLVAKNKNIEIINNIPEEEFFIDCDYNRLKQVFINLLKNSIEAITNKGTIEIDCAKGKKYLKIMFKDSGKGVAKEELANIGELFNTTKNGGSGLGLALSKEIIWSHGGEIKFSSKVGKWFLVEIKLKKAD
jgi:signal transduction histidine kinase